MTAESAETQLIAVASGVENGKGEGLLYFIRLLALN